ncbi:DEDD exonuclease domain-containing protein [Cellulomonas rhizosphaerae]|uniref:DEDD exnuclease domain-containing protein n=1 Tax=Cellulomonas rhizosphaerae TaxID=2293719 RepID=A0A413RL34_9CELL|nr:DEDD exonuclease domain-containing protein [Cellulomonas rhizosphaerae]RHA40294.1 DEDD exnuclease domain-containing protein [Cellulomonas rhizosphaerae]
MSTVRRLRPVWADASVDVSGTPVQPSLDDVGTPLSDVTFVVVDLETTGGTPADCAITEIGAVKVRGGEVLGEFQTLVDPGGPVPPFIQVLTGITTTMLIGAPRIEEVLPAFLEFSRDAVLVAHNAPFDVGFLKAAAARTGHAWPGNRVVDTVRLARRVVTRDEAPNHKLSSLAALFGASVTPNHRALSDARATVDVLHALLSRMAPLGITHLEDLATATDPVPGEVRRKRTLADHLPDSPGVYLFRGPGDEVLYVGTSTTSLRRRVRSYFTSAEKRGRILEMVRIAERVDPVPCATPLEARVRELRLIAEHAPRYNRRSRNPERMPWVRLTSEPFPRLSVVREVRDEDGAAYLGPFGTSRSATLAVEALHEAFEIRQCTRRLPLIAPAGSSACVLADMGRCGAPCIGEQSVPDYAEVVSRVRAAMLADPAPVVAAHAARLEALVDQQRYEEATTVRDRLGAYLRGAARAQRMDPLARCSELVAAGRTLDGGWEIVLVRHGRLAATARVDRRTDPRPVIETLRATAAHVPAPVAPATAAHPEETDLIADWLERPGVRLVEVVGTLAYPVRSALTDVDPAAAVAAHARLLIGAPPRPLALVPSPDASAVVGRTA